MSQHDLQIYVAGLATFGIMKGQQHYRKIEDSERTIVDGTPNTLESFHYVGKSRKLNELRQAGAKVFLDSGAFSAHTTGATINIEEYCDYIKKNQDILRVEDGTVLASVLDGIGDPLLTWQNQMRMEELGVRPLPCFHAGEDERYLEWYIQHYDYITLGGMVGSTQKQLQTWLDRVWNKYLLDGSGNPRIKVHGFGITSVPLMERYPWYSCDSSSWVQATAFGSIVIPGYGALDVSEESPSRHDAGKHISTLTPIERAQVDALLKSQGFDPEAVYSRYYGRMCYNIWAYQEIERRVNEAKRIKGAHEPLPMELF